MFDCKHEHPPVNDLAWEKCRMVEQFREEATRIIEELSGVDRVTLTKIREILGVYDNYHAKLDSIYNKADVALTSTTRVIEGFRREVNNLMPQVNVLGYGVIPDDVSCAKENAEIINDMISQGLGIFFPQGTYFIDGTITVNKSVTISGSGKETTRINYRGDGTLFDIVTGSVTLESFTAQRYDYDFTTESVGISIGKLDNDGRYANVSHVTIKDVNLFAFTYSIMGEALFFFTVRNVFTYWDKIGFALNKRFIEVNGIDNPVETTTILCDHLYCGGSRRTYTEPEDSIGWVIYKASDVTMTNCVSECYHKTGVFENGVNYHLVTPYFEYSKEGLFLNNNTGYFVIDNPYCNSCANETKRIIECVGTHIVSIGGRITTSGYTYISKNSAHTVLMFKPPVGADKAVSSTNGWEYDGTTIFDKKVDVQVSDYETEGVAVSRYSRGLQIKPQTIKQRDESSAINFEVGGYNPVSINKDHLIITGNDGNKYRIRVGYDGQLYAERTT
ncbi:MAG: hypothetical protein J6S23_01245 [Clostridia bacterium]|nr:hypothetical protein [Clostridia bacterium]